MKNPFVFGKVVQGDLFLNREMEISAITETLLSGQNIICYSPRRYGKTSLMMKVSEKLKEQGNVVFLIDFFRVTSLQDLYNIYASSIAETDRSPLKVFLSIIQDILPTINPKVVIKPPDSPTVEISVPLPVLIKSHSLNELFNSLEQYCKKKKKKGIVIFDEFQELSLINDGALIEKEMRSAFQHHKLVSYAFLGSKQNLLKGIFRDKNRPFYNFGRHFELDVIESVHWIDFINKKMGKECSAKMADDILMITENHPYFTQMFCHYLWEYTKTRSKPLDASAIQNVLLEILERDELLMSDLWERITIAERHLLKAIAAEEPENIYEKSFLLRHSLGTASSVQKALKKLLDLDYIRKYKTGRYVFVNPFFKRWIHSNTIRVS
ncbi:MAG: ATP-binding protein [Spirochaetes bacterium]|nr:ATP-binding protein [Spirochaetota bacterium]